MATACAELPDPDDCVELTREQWDRMMGVDYWITTLGPGEA